MTDLAQPKPAASPQLLSPRRSLEPPVPWSHYALTAAEVLVVVALATLVRLLYVEASPHYDEFYHMLAARSWLADGSFRIVPEAAPYDRSWLFTLAVAGAYHLFGESIWAARLPALIGGVALIGAVFGWARHVIGRSAAWLAALALCFLPVAIDLSQMARFYTWQALALWLVAIGVYALVLHPGGGRRQVMVALGVMLAAGLAKHTQDSSLIGLAAIGVWAGVTIVVYRMRWDTPAARRRNGWCLALTGVGLALLTLVAFQTGWAWQKLAMYRTVTSWAAGSQNEVSFYHDLFITWYQAFWYLLPAAIVIALGRYWWPASFCVTIFALAFIAHSFGGMKAERYIFYTLPFLVLIWAMALCALVPVLRHYWFRALDQVKLLPRQPALRGSLLAVALLGVLGFWVYHTPATHVTARLIGPGPIEPTPYMKSRWASAKPKLQKRMQQAGVVLTTSPVKALYYFERNPIGLSRTLLPDGEQFGVNPRTAQPMISDVASVKTLMNKHDRGLIVADVTRWRKRWGVPKPTADFIEKNTQRVSIPAEAHVLAFEWKAEVKTARKSDTDGAQ